MEPTISFGERNSGLQVGMSHAPITANFYSQPERPETPPSPLSNVPFRRDPDFVERGTLLDRIQEKCLAPASRIALVGLGGVGKSQLAIEYCHRVREHSPETWVFWVHASTAGRFEQGFRETVDRVKWPYQDMKRSSMLASQGKHQEAEVMYRKVLEGFEQRLRPNHPRTLGAMSNLGVTLVWQGKAQEAEIMLQQAQTGCERALGADHAVTLSNTDGLGLVLASLGKIKDAEVMHRRALAGREKVLGPDHPYTLLTMRYLANNLERQGRGSEAIEVLQRVVRLQCQALGAEHPRTKSTMAELDRWKRKNNRNQDKKSRTKDV
ncbi:hypothetical protein CFD26_109123 [Aspergillus turcosus]|uniref:NB-ARC domain-containing protein n=1 Tax=Aspergillus turcosus TaxID=1245748 RepID=A0A3R7FZH0_9EURO|nr:hypothetical protein CFD26_109123 [Aspergillus turcosus]